MEAENLTLRRADRRRKRRRRRVRLALWFGALALAAVAAVWLLNGGTDGPERNGMPQAADGGQAGQADTAAEPEPVKRAIVDFRMLDLDTGWLMYDDGTFMVTDDGGVTWREAGPDWTIPEENGMGAGTPDGQTRPEAGGAGADAPDRQTRAEAGGAGADAPDRQTRAEAGGAYADAPGGPDAGAKVTGEYEEAAGVSGTEADGFAGASGAEADGFAGSGRPEADEQAAFLEALREIEAAHLDFDVSRLIVIDGRQIAAKRVQPVSGRIGWALADESGGLENPLLVSVDGGLTWHRQMTGEVIAAIEAERNRRRLRAEEAALYDVPQQVMKPGPGIVLLPNVTYPGDAILARSGEPGEVEWQGKTYVLKPYKAGYFTYLPVPRSTEPGTYTIGGAQLEVRAKKFNTQYLTVTEEMEAMRRNTERIETDQKKVNEARSRSADTFLFDSPFLKPIEGRLSTPYGYTRYINGKLSSTHNAIDLAAPEGTPIAATNDGVVVLADELYLTGLTIYIDHGMGLFSQYAHLSEMHVSAGDTVNKGDIIGLVGSTGFSTGPHLHFTFWVHNTPANPDLFFDTTPFRWTNP